MEDSISASSLPPILVDNQVTGDFLGNHVTEFATLRAEVYLSLFQHDNGQKSTWRGEMIRRKIDWLRR